MLGSLIKRRPWIWTAAGKHPAARDYIRLEGESSLLDALADWAAKGYDQINRRGETMQGDISWRFWLRGAKKSNLICGVGRDSSDHIGRPFPLFIMGEGSLKKWEKQWESAPAFLVKTWQRLEYISSCRYEKISALAKELRTLEQPSGQSMVKPLAHPETTDPNRNSYLVSLKKQLVESGRAMIPMHAHQGEKSAQEALLWHAFVKKYGTDIPRAVFWGGTPQQTYLAVFQDALNTADFIKLWNPAA
ncbi:MAG: type VI secretion system-associated protein TagF [Desulfobacteraceae bacterium]|nr:type VI secretion system-associated protein TagF [Desulfobacteraceae bacterium]